MGKQEVEILQIISKWTRTVFQNQSNLWTRCKLFGNIFISNAKTDSNNEKSLQDWEKRSKQSDKRSVFTNIQTFEATFTYSR